MNYANELKQYVDLTAAVLESLANHCKSTDDCAKCHFSNLFGHCILEQKPKHYNIKLIKQCTFDQLITELENKLNTTSKDGDT